MQLLLPEGMSVPVAVKVLECVGDGLCRFERVYNEVCLAPSAALHKHACVHGAALV